MDELMPFIELPELRLRLVLHLGALIWGALNHGCDVDLSEVGFRFKLRKSKRDFVCEAVLHLDDLLEACFQRVSFVGSSNCRSLPIPLSAMP